MSSLVPVSSSMYRILVADVLPYERPVFFGNRYFVRLLKSWLVEMDDKGNLVSNKKLDENKKLKVDAFLEFLQRSGQVNNQCFQYDIAKDVDGAYRRMRKLTLIHPYDQIRMAYFYKKYHSIILDFCNRSHFSLRYPYKVATHHRKIKGFPHYISDEVAEKDIDEGQRHYFAYRKFKNINQFYESFDFLNAERAYSHMQKLDIHHCFDNISTDILSKALYGNNIEHCKQTIASDFYYMMKSFCSDNSGIVIGPEFSRLFAEMLMQRIDYIIERKLAVAGFKNREDYVFYRYVDDGFLFYDEEEVRGEFEYVYNMTLREYGLSINKKVDKYKRYDHRPFLEGITAAKIKIKVLVKETFANRLITLQGLLNAGQKIPQSPLFLKYQSFIAGIRSIVYEYDIRFKDIATYTLSQIKIKLDDLLSAYNTLLREYISADYFDRINEVTRKAIIKYYNDFEAFSSNLIEILFYFVSCDLRMSTTVKLITIINRLQLFVRGKFRYDNGLCSLKFPSNDIDNIDKKITTELTKLLRDSSLARRCPLEALNLLELEKKMAPKCMLSPKILKNYLNNIEKRLNFFTAFEILHFTKLDSKYKIVNDIILRWLSPKLSKEAVNTEDFYAQLEFLALYTSSSKKIQEEYKGKISRFSEALVDFIGSQRHLFINWDKYDLFSELNNLNSEEVY